MKYAVVATVLLAGLPAYAQDMVFTSWGGTTQDAQTEFWADPFTEATDTDVLQDGPTTTAS